MKPCCKTTVLVADRSRQYRLQLTKELEATGIITAYQAVDEYEVLRMMKTHRPEVVIFDPAIVSGTLRNFIHAILNVSAAVKIVVLSFDDFEELVNECMNIGAKGFLYKAGDVETLINSIIKVSGGEKVISVGYAA
jgi:DNA-binding NarL/FixJ family response regulator